MGRLDDRRERRRLDMDRAGMRSRDLAQRRLDSFLRANLPKLALFCIGVVAMSAALWFVLAPLALPREFVLGLFVAGSLGTMYHWCVLASGAVNGTMGGAAEEWTATELRRLRRHGWRTINHVVFRQGDIDHIAIGPDGVIVIETKWRSDDLEVEDDSDWLAAAARQVKRNERDVAGHLGWGARADARITSLVVVWGPHIEQRTEEAARVGAGVNVVAGERLRAELSQLGDAHLTSDGIDEVYKKLRMWVERKEGWNGDRAAPQRPTLAQLANRWRLRSLFGLAGAYVSILALRLGWWYFAAAAAFLAIGLIVRRRDVHRSDLAAAWIAGSQIITVVVALAVAWNLLA